jgi:TNF receptor-associated factor 2
MFQDTFEDVSRKRGCATTIRLIACPIAKFGCVSELPYDSLLEHYTSQIHQETLLKAIKNYVQELHMISCDAYPKKNLEEDYDYQAILESLNILAEGLSCLQDNNLELHTSSVQLLNNLMGQQKQIEELKRSVEETSQTFHAAQLNNAIIQTDIEAMKQTLSDLSSLSSNDGSFIWKITNISDKIANAISEKQTSIYSAPFYSSPTGYKMCMRLYLCGDGQARRTHISLFFVLMRGDYDAILTWPFQYKITFCLYDLTGTQRHMIDSFRPDIKSNSFQRPRSDMNIASGIPKFMPLSIIQQADNPYVRDDCMFIRCIVDFASLPKKCLPFVVNINPGLPLFIQQNMIQTEIQKHQNPVSTESSLMESSTKTDDLKVNNRTSLKSDTITLGASGNN